MRPNKLETVAIRRFYVVFYQFFSYDGYLREAHRMYKEVLTVCRAFEWPSISKDQLTSPDRGVPVAQFSEGSVYEATFSYVFPIVNVLHGLDSVPVICECSNQAARVSLNN